MPKNRYDWMLAVPPHSAEGTLVIQDNESDNADVLVQVDPHGHLSDKCATRLAEMIAKAMSEAGFEPEYEGSDTE